MDFELLLGRQVGHVKCEQVQNPISQNRLKPIPISWKVLRAGQIWSQFSKCLFLEIPSPMKYPLLILLSHTWNCAPWPSLRAAHV